MPGLNWRLAIEGFGKVRRADIGLAPLTILVGPNNTGKSYIASLLWAVLNNLVISTSLALTPDRGRATSDCVALVRALINQDKKIVGRQEWESIVAWLNEVLAADRVELPSRILAAVTSFERAQLSLTRWPSDLPVEITVEPSQQRRSYPIIRYPMADGRQVLSVVMAEGREPDAAAFSRTARFLARFVLLGRTPGRAVYIPAARTGLMLAYKTLIGALFEGLAEAPTAQRIILPRPIIDFLQELNFSYGISKKEDEEDDAQTLIARDIETNILEGRIDVTENDEFQYMPAMGDVKLPIHAASSLVSELAPFVTLLKGNIFSSTTIIFEEPEAHLHLSAQRLLARMLVRLVNSKVNVVLTTHSDTLVQQLNILMHLQSHRRREQMLQELNYRPDELLNNDVALGYLFNPTPEGTVVVPMSKTREGFIEPMMNRTISEMSKEILRLQEADVE